MKKYFKMADWFSGMTEPQITDYVYDGGIGYGESEAAAYAINSHDELVAEVELLRSVCAEAYQIAGALDAPVEVLDNLLAAANGEDLPHETFLPVASHDLIAEIERLRESLKWAVNNLPFENAFEWSDDENADAHYAALRLLGVDIEE